jgi:hypothetical protein
VSPPQALHAATADLTEDWDVTLQLLLQPDEWRLRAVEQLTVRSARVGLRHRSLHVNPLGPFLSEHVDGDIDTAYVLLPVMMLTKRPLFGFNVSVDGKPAYLVHRRATAEIEAGHVRALAEAAGVATDEVTDAVLAAVCEFTPTPWQRFRATYRAPRQALRRYLEQGLWSLAEESPQMSWVARARGKARQAMQQRFPGLTSRSPRVDRPVRTPLRLSDEEFNRLRTTSAAIGRRMREALGEGASATSSADAPLLVAPLLAEQGLVTSVGDLQEALDGLKRFVDDLVVAANDSRQPLALRVLADYGRRWQAMAWCEVPLRRPFVIVAEHQVPLRFSRVRPWARQPFELADARSNHVTLEVAVENVDIAGVQLRGVDGARTERTLATGLRQSREHFGLYTSEPDRDQRGILRFSLRAPLAIRVPTWTIHALSWAAVVMLALSLHRETLTSSDLAVLVVPTTFAATLLLTRERNSLAYRLQRLSRLGTALATALLWTLATYAYVFSHVAAQ